jgi:hypothetical protein
MRVSINKDDPGFDAYQAARAAGKSVHVYLDGVEVKACLMADDDLGTVTRHVLNADGQVQIDPEKRDEVWTETVNGKVEIRFEGGH